MAGHVRKINKGEYGMMIGNKFYSRILMILCISIFLLSSCTVQNNESSKTAVGQTEITQEITETTPSKVEENDENFYYEQQLTKFLKNPEFVKLCQETTYEAGVGGPRISLLDMTGDDIPEILITLCQVKYSIDLIGKTTMFDLQTFKPLLTFNGAPSSDSSILRYIDQDGIFKCIVTECFYTGDGRSDAIITEITPQNDTFDVLTKYAFRCVKSETTPYIYSYYIFENLTQEENKLFREYDASIDDIIKTNLPTSLTFYLSYISSMKPLETNWQQVGVFRNADNFEPEPGFEAVTQAIEPPSNSLKR